MKDINNIINLFEETLKLNPDKSFEFELNSDNPELYWEFIDKYIRENTDIIKSHNGKITFVVTGNNIGKFICGVAPMWKQYEDSNSFENYYTNSEMMRTLFCNEKNNDVLVPIYVEFNDGKQIITWESDKNTDTFHYRNATIVERGLLDVLYEIFGGGTINTIKYRQRLEYKKLNPHIGISYNKKITNNFGFDIGFVKSICDHVNNLGYDFDGEFTIRLG